MRQDQQGCEKTRHDEENTQDSSDRADDTCRTLDVGLPGATAAMGNRCDQGHLAFRAFYNRLSMSRQHEGARQLRLRQSV